DFIGDLKVFHRVHLAALQHRVELGPQSHIALQASYTFDTTVSETAELVPGSTARPLVGRTYDDATRRGDLVLRADAVSDGALGLRAGVEYAHRTLRAEGSVLDLRFIPPWPAYPSSETHELRDPYVSIAPHLVRDLGAVYAEETAHPSPSL